MNKKETLKQQILQLSREYYDEVHRNLKVFLMLKNSLI